MMKNRRLNLVVGSCLAVVGMACAGLWSEQLGAGDLDIQCTNGNFEVRARLVLDEVSCELREVIRTVENNALLAEQLPITAVAVDTPIALATPALFPVVSEGDSINAGLFCINADGVENPPNFAFLLAPASCLNSVVIDAVTDELNNAVADESTVVLVDEQATPNLALSNELIAFNQDPVLDNIRALVTQLEINPPQSEEDANQRFQAINQESLTICGELGQGAPECLQTQAFAREARLVLLEQRAEAANLNLETRLQTASEICSTFGFEFQTCQNAIRLVIDAEGVVEAANVEVDDLSRRVEQDRNDLPLQIQALLQARAPTQPTILAEQADPEVVAPSASDTLSELNAFPPGVSIVSVLQVADLTEGDLSDDLLAALQGILNVRNQVCLASGQFSPECLAENERIANALRQIEQILAL